MVSLVVLQHRSGYLHPHLKAKSPSFAWKCLHDACFDCFRAECLIACFPNAYKWCAFAVSEYSLAATLKQKGGPDSCSLKHTSAVSSSINIDSLEILVEREGVEKEDSLLESPVWSHSPHSGSSKYIKPRFLKKRIKQVSKNTSVSVKQGLPLFDLYQPWVNPKRLKRCSCICDYYGCMFPNN